MVSVLTLSVVDRGFQPISDQTKDYAIGNNQKYRYRPSDLNSSNSVMKYALSKNKDGRIHISDI
jgi:hypothetical protein